MTRQWLAQPNNMCVSHITGEHAEAHGFLTKMHRGQALEGFTEGSMFFGAEYVKARHDLLAYFLKGHTTPLDIDERLRFEYPLVVPTMENLKESIGVLVTRCQDCRTKHGIRN